MAIHIKVEGDDSRNVLVKDIRHGIIYAHGSLYIINTNNDGGMVIDSANNKVNCFFYLNDYLFENDIKSVTETDLDLELLIN